MCLTHILAGALIGRLSRHRGGAFTLGVLSHIPLDMLPHFDSTRGVEFTTTALGLSLVGEICGIKSPEFWGAVGGVAPDIEVGLERLDIVRGRLLFPTHRYGSFHGRRFPLPILQLISWAIALSILSAPKISGFRSKGHLRRRERSKSGYIGFSLGSLGG